MLKQKSRILGAVGLAAFTALICFAVISCQNGKIIPAFSRFFNSGSVELNPGLGAGESLIILSPSEAEFSSDTPLVSFVGYCLPDKPLKINSIPVSVESDGAFKYDYSLNSGENAVTVTNGDKSFTYKIKYDLSVIRSVYPDTDVTINSDMVLRLSADALSGSKIYAVIGARTVELKCGDSSEGIFKTYFADYTVPSFESDREELGNIKFYAEFGDYKEEKSGGKLSVLKSIKEYTLKSGRGSIVAPEILPDNTVKLLSPEFDHSLGSARMCVVTKNYAEVLPASTADDRSDPRFTPYLSGTVDYITSECKYDNQEYCILLSGVKIAKKNIKPVTGYIMPMNTVSAASADGSSVILTLNWKVPFVSQLKLQSYYTGHASRAFNVRKFTASYIDFVFKYTNAVPDSDSVFGENSPVSFAQWLDIGKDGTSTLRVFLKEKGAYYGYRAYYSSDNRLVISFKEKPLSNKKIVLDAGHGGKDCGAIGANGTYESNINIDIAERVKNYLENNGVSVVMTRRGDSFSSLDERQDFARAENADMFIAVHSNSSEDVSLSGTEAYYYTAFSMPLASAVHSKLAGVWRELYLNNSLMYDKIIPRDGGVRFFPYQVIRIEECPAVLIECGYLSNPTECDMLSNGENREKIAKAISDGVLEYYNQNK